MLDKWIIMPSYPVLKQFLEERMFVDIGWKTYKGEIDNFTFTVYFRESIDICIKDNTTNITTKKVFEHYYDVNGWIEEYNSYYNNSSIPLKKDLNKKIEQPIHEKAISFLKTEIRKIKINSNL